MYQPGSTVCTSHIEAEAKPKGFGVFEVQDQCQSFEQGFLRKSARPFSYHQIDLDKQLQNKAR